MEVKTKLVSFNTPGNLHAVTSYVNRMGFSDFFVQAHCTGNNSVVVLKVPIDWPMEDHNPLPVPGYG